MTSAKNGDSSRRSNGRHGKSTRVESEGLIFVLLRRYESDLDAEVAKGHLEAAGIDSRIIKDDAGGMFPSLQQSGGVQLLVAGARLDEALSVIRPRLALE